MATLVMKPLSREFGVEIEGIDFRNGVDTGLADSLRAAMDEHSLLLFRNQDITAEQHLAVAKVFGEVSRQGAAERSAAGNVSFISNVEAQGRGGEGILTFHSDQASFAKPQQVLTLYAVTLPSSGGDTLYSSMSAAYDALPATLKDRIAGLHLINRFDYKAYFTGVKATRVAGAEDADVASAVHPIALPHPRTNKISLYISEPHAYRVQELSPEESDELLAELNTYMHRPDNVYTHKWQPRDLVLWDNMSLQHARTAWNPSEPRTLRRVQIS